MLSVNKQYDTLRIVKKECTYVKYKRMNKGGKNLKNTCGDIVSLFSLHPFRNSSKILTKPSTIGFREILSRALFI